MLSRIIAICGALLMSAAIPSVSSAQSWEAEWKATVEKAKSQSLVFAQQPSLAIDAILAEFTKKFGIKVAATISRPSATLTRMQTEQKNGQYVWDVWMGGTSNMVNSAAPAGMLEPLENYFILPEVKEAANWRHPNFIYGDSGKRVFTHLNELSFPILRNEAVLPELKIATLDSLLDPRLKGKISMRDASVPNFGTFALATIYHAKGPEFLTRLLKEQDVKVYANPQQLETAITRGGQAISIGLESSLWEQCRRDGGCKSVDELKQFSIAISWGLSVPKNPPNPEATKVWLNWFLSKEGQEIAVREWAKVNNSGAVSMRKDVEPAPGHAQYLPDFTQPDQYVFVSSEKGSQEINETIKIFKAVTGN
jgi:iron(III) transport system substrate-binding protein